MKKLSLLLGTVGGALAGYVFSNKKLRSELSKAKDATEAAQVLGKHLSKDGQTVAKEVGELAEQYHLDDKVEQGKTFVTKYYKSAKAEAEKFLGKKVKEATTAIKSAKGKVAGKVRGKK
ncbi:MAG: hypothetical protein ABL890_01795 [Candidatus Peribacteraceae bacterium]